MVGENGPRVLGSLATLEGCGQLDFEVDQQRFGSGEQQVARGFVFDGASAESEDQRVSGGEARDGGALALAEGSFAVAGKNLGDGRAGFSFDYVVHIDEAPAQARCD